MDLKKYFETFNLIHNTYFELFTVLYLASAKSKISENLLVAFYLGEYGELFPYILDGLPENYYENEDSYLLNYEGYVNICKLTGEDVLSIRDYFRQYVKQDQGLGVNSIMFHEGKKMNFNQQKEFWANMPEKQT